MNWQTPAALAIVALTAGIFLWLRLRPRKINFAKASGCGCIGKGPTSNPQGIVVRSRRGESQRIEFRPSVDKSGRRR